MSAIFNFKPETKPETETETVDLNTLSESELCRIFESAEEENVYDSLFYRVRAELFEESGKKGEKYDFDNAAIVESWNRFEAMSKPEKAEFLRAVHFDWLSNHDYK